MRQAGEVGEVSRDELMLVGFSFSFDNIYKFIFPALSFKLNKKMKTHLVLLQISDVISRSIYF